MLASPISLDTLKSALQVIGYPAIVLFVFIECVGIPLPAETMLLLASFYAATDNNLQLPIVILCAALGAILGDNVGYQIGRTGGRAIVERFGRYFFVKMEHLERAELFFTRHGAKTVFFGRFVTLLRIWSAFLAGMNRMHWPTFMLYNGLGGIVWSLYVSLLGYVAGRVFHEHFDQVEQLAHTLGWIGLVLAILVSVALFLFVRRRIIGAPSRSTAAEAEQEHSIP